MAEVGETGSQEPVGMQSTLESEHLVLNLLSAISYLWVWASFSTSLSLIFWVGTRAEPQFLRGHYSHARLMVAIHVCQVHAESVVERCWQKGCGGAASASSGKSCTLFPLWILPSVSWKCLSCSPQLPDSPMTLVQGAAGCPSSCLLPTFVFIEASWNCLAAGKVSPGAATLR